MRIVSLLPSATEIVAALGIENELVGISHECDYPPELVADKPVLTHSAIPAGLSPAEVDAYVSERLRRGESLYLLDEALLDELQPDVILTQELCDVCAVSSKTVRDAACRLASDPRVVSLEPTTIAGILDNVRTVAALVGVPERAEQLIAHAHQRLARLTAQVRGVASRPNVYCMEWLMPPYNAGHWVPEMVALAGGTELLGNPGKPSVRLTWQQIIASQPDYLLLMPCGYTVETIVRELASIEWPETFWQMPAVQHGRVYALNATAYFSRPGPRVIDGVELLAGLLHAERVPPPDPSEAQVVGLAHSFA
ncbi:MAG: cobalamin-binding protein [Chloroflexi bacterium]|nr:cobalamin-binding protein [Chloroflexota bacterium]MBI3733391.1 cobalamin-binding protein [Chloroflexota bacterium]